jgi:hypothetical protein
MEDRLEIVLNSVTHRVVARLKGTQSVMYGGTMWDDYIDHVDHGWSIIEEQFMVVVDAWIELELKPLPEPIIHSLWLLTTDNGSSLLFELSYELDHAEPFLTKEWEERDSEPIQDLVSVVRDRMNALAEADSPTDD